MDSRPGGDTWHLITDRPNTVPSTPPAVCKCTDGKHDWQKGMWLSQGQMVKEHNALESTNRDAAVREQGLRTELHAIDAWLDAHQWLAQGRGPYADDDHGYDQDVQRFIQRLIILREARRGIAWAVEALAALDRTTEASQRGPDYSPTPEEAAQWSE